MARGRLRCLRCSDGSLHPVGWVGITVHDYVDFEKASRAVPFSTDGTVSNQPPSEEIATSNLQDTRGRFERSILYISCYADNYTTRSWGIRVEGR